jgi:hypothetical protein
VILSTLALWAICWWWPFLSGDPAPIQVLAESLVVELAFQCDFILGYLRGLWETTFLVLCHME